MDNSELGAWVGVGAILGAFIGAAVMFIVVDVSLIEIPAQAFVRCEKGRLYRESAYEYRCVYADEVVFYNLRDAAHE